MVTDEDREFVENCSGQNLINLRNQEKVIYFDGWRSSTHQTDECHVVFFYPVLRSSIMDDEIGMEIIFP